MSSPGAGGTATRDPLLATKLAMPGERRALVARPRLLDRLDEGRSAALTLVAAPAGSGKSTVVAAWARRGDRPVAWLSLDVADNDPARLARYLVAAITAAGSGGTAGEQGALRDMPDAPHEGMLGAL